MIGRGFTIATVRGIPVRVDPTWLVIMLLVAWSYWARFETDHTVGVAVLMGVATAVLFFLSVLAHELAHALEAQRRGIRVSGITLYLFGGATEASLDAGRPVDELTLTFLGPWTSIVLGAAFGLLAWATSSPAPVVSNVAGVLGWTNVLLGVFNLLPGAPLDGGRILAAIAWQVTGDRYRGHEVAGQAGRLIGGLLIAAGLVELFSVVGGAPGGLWLAFIGWFLLQAATAEVLRSRVARSLEGVAAGALVGPRVDAVRPNDSVQWAIDDHGLRHPASHHPVVADDGVIGVLGPGQVRTVPREQRATTAVATAMAPVDRLPKVRVDEPATTVLERLGEGDAEAVAIVDDGTVVGVVTPEILEAVLRRADRLHGRRQW